MGISFKNIHDPILEVCCWIYWRIDGSVIDGQLERAIVNSITDVDSQITKFCTVFADLRKNFDLRSLVHVSLVMSRMTSPIDAIRGYL